MNTTLADMAARIGRAIGGREADYPVLAAFVAQYRAPFPAESSPGVSLLGDSALSATSGLTNDD